MKSVSKKEAGCCGPGAAPCPCPVCGDAGRKVSAVTLNGHLPGPLRAAFGDEATFCLNPTCGVVYCNPAGMIARKEQTVLPVTIKDEGDDVPVCYCFGFTRSDLREGQTAIPDLIRKGIDEGRCDCERMNPQGACCLGNVARAIRNIQGRGGQ